MPPRSSRKGQDQGANVAVLTFGKPAQRPAAWLCFVGPSSRRGSGASKRVRGLGRANAGSTPKVEWG
eukprot:15455631-Alexandrium_andersonii.AAC.1